MLCCVTCYEYQLCTNSAHVGCCISINQSSCTKKERSRLTRLQVKHAEAHEGCGLSSLLPVAHSLHYLCCMDQGDSHKNTVSIATIIIIIIGQSLHLIINLSPARPLNLALSIINNPTTQQHNHTTITRVIFTSPSRPPFQSKNPIVSTHLQLAVPMDLPSDESMNPVHLADAIEHISQHH